VSDGLERAVSADYLRAIVERLESFRSHPLGFRVAGLELGLRGAAAMILTSSAGGPYYQAEDALHTPYPA
jgi:hypothetical protein